MTTLTLVLRPGATEARSVDALAGRALFGALGGLIIPATPAVDAPASHALIPGERYVSDVAATVFEGSAATGALVSELAAPTTRAYWCAVGVALPRGDKLERQPWLRFGPPPRVGLEALWPIALASRVGDALELRFPRGGAPFVPPPSRDHGGPIDQSWREAADLALDALAVALGRATEDELRATLVIENASQLARARLDRALREIAGASIEAR
jgi:hypothetical protein